MAEQLGGQTVAPVEDGPEVTSKDSGEGESLLGRNAEGPGEGAGGDGPREGDDALPGGTGGGGPPTADDAFAVTNFHDISISLHANPIPGIGMTSGTTNINLTLLAPATYAMAHIFRHGDIVEICLRGRLKQIYSTSAILRERRTRYV